MAVQLPVELMDMVMSYIDDHRDLLALSRVGRYWSQFAWSRLERLGRLSVDPNAMADFNRKYGRILTRQRINEVVVIVPDRDYWHVRDPNTGAVVTPHLESVVSYLALLHILKKKLPNLPRLTRLSFYIRPPRQALAPISAGPVIPKNQTLTDILTDFTAALKKIGDRRIVNRSLKELSLECFPARIAWPASPGRWNPKAVQIERIFRRLQLESLKLSVVSPTIWQFGNPQFAADPSTWATVNIFDPPRIWTTGGAWSLKHLSLSYWGFYVKNITGSRYLDIFQKLESLELRGCAFTSDIQVTWLMAHTTVRTLVLDDCTIVYKLLLRDPNPVIENSASVQMAIEEGGAMQGFRLVWSDVFRRLLTWPRLREFHFGSSRERQTGEEGPFYAAESIGPPLGQGKPKFLFGLFPDRYSHLANGPDRCEWILRPSPAQMTRPDWVVNAQNGDRAGLRALLAGLGQTVVENDGSGHAGYVVDLIGKVRGGRSESQ